MFFIICYDTPSDRRRRKLHRMLKNYAVAVQKSVFETFLEGTRFEEMLKRIGNLVDPSVDSVRIYSMTRESQREMKLIGFPGLLQDPDHFVIGDGRTTPPEVIGEDEETGELPAWL